MRGRSGASLLRALGFAAGLLALSCGGSAKKAATPPATAAGEQPMPLDLQPAIKRALALGRMLYVFDKVSAIGTDVLLAANGNAKPPGLGGYLTLPEGDAEGNLKDSFLVTFYDREVPPRVLYDVRIARDQKPELERFDPPKAMSADYLALARARQVAIDAMPKTGQPINPVLLPGAAVGEDGVLVYLLAGTTEPHLAIFGIHYRALVAIGADRVRSIEALSKSALRVPTKSAAGESVEGLTVTHLVSDYPLETHVFTSLLVKLPVYVATRRGLFRVNGDDIKFLGELH